MGLISDRLNRLAPSPTVAITDMALNMKAAGQTISGLAAGEPDFDTPQHIRMRHCGDAGWQNKIYPS